MAEKGIVGRGRKREWLGLRGGVNVEHSLIRYWGSKDPKAKVQCGGGKK